MDQLMELETLEYDVYERFVNKPKHLINPDDCVRMFDNPVLEFFTLTPWWSIFVVYLPQIFYYSIRSVLPLYTNIMLILLGVYTWTLIEYLISRFLLYAEALPKCKTSIMTHFLLGGVHRAFPTEKFRIMCPVFPSNFLLHIIIIPVNGKIFPEVWLPSITAGGLIGYIFYEMLHYLFHHNEFS
jgi:hypothetical protein